MDVIHADPGERNTRIVRYALGYLEPAYHEHFLSSPRDKDERCELAKAYQGDETFWDLLKGGWDALHAVFWKLGLTINPGVRHRRLVRQCPMIARIMDLPLGSDPMWTEFACLVCGNPVRVPFGKRRKFTCLSCNHGSWLRYNNGRRIAFVAEMEGVSTLDAEDTLYLVTVVGGGE